jgi:hypothetical protein
LFARRSGKCRIITRTSSLLQSQKLVSNSRSSSGVNRSEEKVVTDGSIIPTAVGPNPSKTIGAMAERISQKIVERGV